MVRRRWRKLVLALNVIADDGRLLMLLLLHLKQTVGSTSGNRCCGWLHKSNVVWWWWWLLLLIMMLLLRRWLWLLFTVNTTARIRRRFRSGCEHGANRIVMVMVIIANIVCHHWDRVYIDSVIIFGSHSTYGGWNDAHLPPLQLLKVEFNCFFSSSSSSSFAVTTTHTHALVTQHTNSTPLQTFYTAHIAWPSDLHMVLQWISISRRRNSANWK